MEVGPRVPETVGALERQLREDARRGQRMEDRKDRLLHAKTRLIGVGLFSFPLFCERHGVFALPFTY